MLHTPANAPVALGAGPEDDPYILPSFLAAMVTTVAGLRAVNLGPDTPLTALQQAVQTTFVGRDYERAADHAVTIGHWVQFIATGVLPGHDDETS